MTQTRGQVREYPLATCIGAFVERFRTTNVHFGALLLNSLKEPHHDLRNDNSSPALPTGYRSSELKPLLLVSPLTSCRTLNDWSLIDLEITSYVKKSV
ncbi:hypothetical protein PM082_015826 [Marasmius tenuissimus]|nr:hypothetical protein PM082_015826 [Marasmius tenuissimus]